MLIIATLLPAAEYQYYRVRKGDNLYNISKRNGVTVAQLKKLNGLKSDRLDIGQSIKIKELPKKETKKNNDKNKVAQTTANKPANTTQQQSVTPKSTTDNSNRNTALNTPESQADYPENAQLTPLPNLPDDYYHIVKPKENLYRIAMGANITIPELLRYNRFPDEHVLIKTGMKVIVKDPALFNQQPAGTTATPENAEVDGSDDESSAAEDSVVIEKVYVVQKKDTLFKIAKANNMTVEQLKQINHITDNAIKTGQRLYIVAPKGGVEPEITKPVPVVITEEELKAKARIRDDLIMPSDSHVISEYGIRNGRPHKGLDLGAPTGTPIYAVLDGTVVYSGHQGNYGNVVVIEHPDFIMTVYGHNEKNLVNVGDVVKQGQIIATTGSTGNATAPHVHFEYRIKGKAINPRKVLPLNK